VEKAITTSTVEDSGKANAASASFSGLLDEEPRAKPVQKPKPAAINKGLIVSEPLAKRIAEGEAKHLEAVKGFSSEEAELFLVSSTKALGTVTMGVSEDGVWPIKKVHLFDRPKGTNIAPTQKGIVAGVRLIDRVKAKVQTETIDKAKDLKSYSPKRVSDSVLRADFRIAVAWCADGTRGDQAKSALIKILKEAKCRGPKVMQFNLRGMLKSERKVFESAAKRVGLPKEMFVKLKISKSMDPEEYTNAELAEAHERLHRAHGQPVVKGWTSTDVVNMHARIVDVLKVRGIDHPAPPVDELDPLSCEFEEVEKAEELPPMPDGVSVEKVDLVKGPVELGESFTLVPVAKSQLPPSVGCQDVLKAFTNKKPESFPVHLQKWHGGERVQIHKSGGVVTVFGDRGVDVTKRLPGLVEEVKALKPSSCVLDAQLEAFDAGEKQACEVVQKYLQGTGKADDSHLVASVTDVVHLEKAITSWPACQRLKKVDQLGIKQSTMHAPSIEGRLNSAPVVVAKDLQDLEIAARTIRAMPGAKGVVIKHADSKYFEAEGTAYPTPDKQETKKAEDLFEMYPPQAKRHRFVVQQHWQGKEMRALLRLETLKKKLLTGWSVLVQKPGVVKQPVTTLASARSVSPEVVSSIDWNSGKWASDVVMAQRMTPSPAAWLDAEGKTKDPEHGKAPPIGGTSEFPGVFQIVDQGLVEFGAQKPWLHEYFLKGKGFNYRVIFRQTHLGTLEKGQHSHGKCMECKGAAPTIDVLWADGRGRAWFCAKCYPQWLKALGGKKKAEVVQTKQILGGNAPIKFSDVHKSAQDASSAEVEKRAPPVEGLGELVEDEPKWVMVQPDSNRPLVLDSESVTVGWVPPLGASALPKAVRDQIPDKFKYWKCSTLDLARRLRDDLVKAIADGKVLVDFDAPYQGGRQKLTKKRAAFVLQEYTQKGEVSHVLRVDQGGPHLSVVELSANPIQKRHLDAMVGTDSRVGSMEVSGKIRAGHYANVSKRAASEVIVLDRGTAEVLKSDAGELEVWLDGKELQGGFRVEKNLKGWDWAPFDVARAQEITKEKEAVEKAADDILSKQRFVPIQKVDTDKRLIIGVVLEPDEVDAQKDTIKAEAIERASIKFLANYNLTTKLGFMHKKFGDIGLQLAHSWVALEDTKIGGKKVKKGTWLMTMKVVRDALWKDVKAGKYAGFSIGGVATVS
jgi:hypothetical protein